MISKDKFKIVVENTPLVSIDFIIENRDGHYLLGKRVNKPAQGFWFALGGRIFKNGFRWHVNETFDTGIIKTVKCYLDNI